LFSIFDLPQILENSPPKLGLSNCNVIHQGAAPQSGVEIYAAYWLVDKATSLCHLYRNLSVFDDGCMTEAAYKVATPQTSSYSPTFPGISNTGINVY